MYEEANKELNTDRRNTVELKPYSQVYVDRKLMLYANIVKASNDDPVKTATLNARTLQSPQVAYRRSGRPRKSWTSQTTKQFWHRYQAELPIHLRGTELDLNNVAHRNAIETIARQR